MDLLQDNRCLLDAFRRGDETALSEVYSGYAESVFFFLRKGFAFNSRDRNFSFGGFQQSWQLEDAVQDVFLRAFREEARIAYDGLRPFKHYLFTIARNRIIDSFRKEKSKYLDIRELSDIDEKEMVHDHETPTAEEISGDKELKESVSKFIKGLDEQQMALFQIRFVEGQSLEEVCKKLTLTDYRAKQHEKQIKKQFFQYMQERGYFSGYVFRDDGLQKLLVTILIAAGRGC